MAAGTPVVASDIDGYRSVARDEQDGLLVAAQKFASLPSLQDELQRLQPAEILYSSEQGTEFSDLRAASPCDGYTFLYDQAHTLLREHFAVQSLDGFG